LKHFRKQKPDYEKFPLFRHAVPTEVLLKRGEVGVGVSVGVGVGVSVGVGVDVGVGVGVGVWVCGWV